MRLWARAAFIFFGGVFIWSGTILVLAQQGGCERYADRATAQQEENLRRGCGYEGPRWHSRYRTHLEWCRRIPKEDAFAETRFRDRALERCGDEVWERDEPRDKNQCVAYARRAVAQQAENLHLGCGFEGARWHSRFGVHLEWCEQVRVATAWDEVQFRDNALARCGDREMGEMAPSRCHRYAQIAVEQNGKNLRWGCGQRGRYWHSRYGEHLEWCQSVSPGKSAEVIEKRRRRLHRCQ